MQTKNNLILVVAIAGLVLWGQPKLRDEARKLLPNSSPAVDVPSPDATAQAAVAPVTTALRGHPQEAKTLAAFFRDFATVQSKFPERFDSIAELETHIAASTKLLDELKAINVDGINQAVGGALTAMLGSDEAKKLDSGTVNHTLLALAWGCK